jgi:site-specific DNA-methyltransferase (adenine-specific)
MNDFQILCGNNLDKLKEFPDNYFDAIVTDPPYGLGNEPNAEEMLKAWIESGYMEVKGVGFMGKEWDSFVPQPLFWKEAFRVLKHGGHIVSFFGTRTYDWGVMAMRLAGFEVRDCIQWVYGSGFPKSHNISKAIDKMQGAEREIVGKKECGYQVSISKTRFEQGHRPNLTNSTKEVNVTAPATEKAKEWDGWGSALKPANEPIVLARKPLEKGLSIAENVLKWGTGGINIDGCRVGTDGATKRSHQAEYNKDENGKEDRSENWMRKGHSIIELEKGRFPANLILTHHPDCVCNGLKKVISDSHHTTKYNGNTTLYEGGWKEGNDMGNKFADANGKETIEDWTCHEDCPIKIMDEQSGESKSVVRKPNGKPILDIEKGWNNNSMIDKTIRGMNDKGGASRFFYCAKASKKEKNVGLNGFAKKQTTGGGGGVGDYIDDVDSPSGKFGSEKAPSKNFHPTIKPINLMQYLVRLITPPNGIVLDPFMGSGTTGVACKLEGVSFVGIEMNPEYHEIAAARIENFIEESELPENLKIEDNQNDENQKTEQLKFNF